jgi:hypothetical protein
MQLCVLLEIAVSTALAEAETTVPAMRCVEDVVAEFAVELVVTEKEIKEMTNEVPEEVTREVVKELAKELCNNSVIVMVEGIGRMVVEMMFKTALSANEELVDEADVGLVVLT